MGKVVVQQGWQANADHENEGLLHLLTGDVPPKKSIHLYPILTKLIKCITLHFYSAFQTGSCVGHQ